MADKWALYDPRPSGKLCWAVMWVDENRPGWWVQHGDNREARRFFSYATVPQPFPPVIPEAIVDWMRESHAHLPCEPKEIVRELAYFI